jgi:hypothetical protein
MALRYIIVKDYYTEAGDNCTDTWCILYDKASEAEAVKQSLENGQDKSFFDVTLDNSAFLYVDVIEVDNDQV